VAEAQVLNITENIQREDLSPVEIANAVMLLLNLGFKQNEISQKIGKSPTWVSNSIEFRRSATPQLRDAVQEGKISYVLGRQIATLGDGDQREKVAELTEDDGQPAGEESEAAETKKGRAADVDIRTKIRESSSRIIRPTIGELRQQLAALRVAQKNDEEFGDYELGLLVGMEWCLGEKKTLLRPQTEE
jgi:ParB-like chromosome segregation protein Spo0J